MLVKAIFEKPYIFQKSIFKKMPPDTPRNRIRDLSGASLLVVKGFPKSILFSISVRAARSKFVPPSSGPGRQASAARMAASTSGAGATPNQILASARIHSGR